MNPHVSPEVEARETELIQTCSKRTAKFDIFYGSLTPEQQKGFQIFKLNIVKDLENIMGRLMSIKDIKDYTVEVVAEIEQDFLNSIDLAEKGIKELLAETQAPTQ